MTLLLALILFSQFDVASVKLSARTVGPDFGNVMAYTPSGFSAKNTTLKRLIAEAYNVRPFQVMGGPKWLDSAEYDITARAADRTAQDGLRLMLQDLIRERFHLTFHRQTRYMPVYNLIGAGELKLKPGAKNLDQFAAFLAVQLSIHGIDDPARPGIASAAPVPVFNRTGLTGSYDLNLEVRPEPGVEMFTAWQRVLREQLGLQLVNAKADVEILVIDTADRAPVEN